MTKDEIDKIKAQGIEEWLETEVYWPEGINSIWEKNAYSHATSNAREYADKLRAGDTDLNAV